ncbi:hypothetical protein AbraIFM66950_005288 [Aspergillus brasiliensis]|nr:hypothetical protein AbraIFM66950_005288 [Aspergillus brasiliensis]
MCQLPEFVSPNAELQAKIVDAITETMDGIFLLAHFHLDSLVGKPSVKAIRKALEQLPSGTDKLGRTPLMAAAATGNAELVRLLLDTGKVTPKRRDSYGHDAAF